MFKVGERVKVVLASENYESVGTIIAVDAKKSLPFKVEVDTPFFTVFNDPITVIPCSYKELTLCK